MRSYLSSRVRAVVLSIVVLGVVWVGVPAPAGAATLTWSESPSALQQFAYGFPPRTLSFPQAGNSAFASVSCVSSRFCIAVGAYSSSPPLDTLIEKWDGKAWSVMPRSSVENGTLTGVSCTSPTFCAVVGYGPTGTGTAALLERWDGTNWILDESPAVGTPSSTLSSVSCVSKVSCTAVGSGTGPSTAQTLVEVWNGVIWSVVASPNPPAGTSAFNSVSCRSTTACIAVGSHAVDPADSSSAGPLTERWNGTTWSLLANPTVSAPAFLTGVSCSHSSWCVAVGLRGSSTLAEVWNGRVWGVIQSPTGTVSTSVSFSAISCPRALDCVATEHSNGPSPSASHSFVETWHGAWTLGTGAAGEPGGLGGVSCAGKKFCVAVGGYNFPVIHGTTALVGRA